jgi:hypothetical protein
MSVLHIDIILSTIFDSTLFGYFIGVYNIVSYFLGPLHKWLNDLGVHIVLSTCRLFKVVFTCILYTCIHRESLLESK